MNKLLNAIKNHLEVEPTTTAGSAWATPTDLKDARLLHNDGIILGRNPYGVKKDDADFIRYDGPEHILVTVPARTGKRCGGITPNLLTWPHSVVVLDWKGENWEITAGYRKKHLGNRVLRFAPTMDDGSSATFNPLSEIRLGTVSEWMDVRQIASALVNPEGKGLLDHWVRQSHQLLVGTILHLMYVCRNEGRGVPSLADVAGFLSRSDTTFDAILEEMKNYQHRSEDDYVEIPHSPVLPHADIMETVSLMQSRSKNEQSSVVTTALDFLAPFCDPGIAKFTSSSSFSVVDLLREDIAVSLYLVSSPADISHIRPLFRMILQLTIYRHTKKSITSGRTYLENKQRLLLLLDDFLLLGPMKVFADTLPFLNRFRIQAFFLTHSLEQLDRVYPDDSLINHFNIRIFYTPNDARTAMYVSSMLGNTPTQVVGEDIISQSTFVIVNGLLSPCEILRLAYEDSIILVNGCPPILAKKLFYFNEEFFKSRLMDAPVQSDTIR